MKRQITHFPDNDSTNGWAAGLPPRRPRPVLQGDIRADWVVVGAGLAGLAAARRLGQTKPDDRIVVIDAGAVADAASGRNSGFAIDLPHTVSAGLDENKGAHGFMRLARAAIASLKESVDIHGIDCQWRRKGKYQAAVTARGAREILNPFADALTSLDEPFEWVRGDDLAARLGTTHFHSAIYTPGCVLLNPVALVRGLADSLPENVELYEHTPALSVENHNGITLTTPEGSVFAPQMILAVNGFAEQFGAFQRQTIPLAVHASLTRPLTSAEQAAYGVTEDWGLTPANSFVGITMRFTPDKRILIREKMAYRPQMSASNAERAAVAVRHKRLFDDRFPMLPNVGMAHTWTGFIALTRNGVPGFGRVAPGVHAAVCQNGIGITKGTIGGILAADMATGRENPLLADIEALGRPMDLPPEPFLGLGVRARMEWELWSARHEA